MISLQTNVNSLVAQQNLNVNSAFQSRTIAELTSGYRINQSGDDAAGLAIANKYRSSIAELTQGVANGNDGVAQLQIMDGGMSNISQILDRLKTLATQSASGTITDQTTRDTLNSEFQTDLGEVDRQAQSIGLNTGGSFAKSLSVYLGAGTGSTNLANATVTVDLTASAVDTQSLGLKGMEAVNTATDIGTNSGTSVQNIINDSSNQEATAGYASFQFSGAGFSDAGKQTISVNLSGVTDVSTLAAAVNNAIQQTGQGNSAQATAFKNANIVASAYTDSATGHQALAFSSGAAAFQVQAGDQMANALLGNLQPSSTLGVAVSGTSTTSVTGSITTAGTFAAAQAVKLEVTGGGLASPVTLALNTSNPVSTSQAITDLENQFQANSQLQSAGLTMSGSAVPGGRLSFNSATGQSFNVQVTGDTSNLLGLGSFLTNGAGDADYNKITAQAAYSATAVTGSVTTQGIQANLQISVDGQAASALTPIDLTNGTTATVASVTSSGAVGSNSAVDITPTTNSLNITVTNNGVVTNKIISLTANTVATTAATASTLTGGTSTALSSSVALTPTNNQFTISVDGGPASTITVGTGVTYGTTVTGATTLLNDINAAITAATGANSSLTDVTAVWNASGQLALTTISTGANAQITIGDKFATVKSGAFAMTSGTFTSGITVGTTGDTNSSFSIAVDGDAAVKVTVGTATATTYTTGTQLAAAIQAGITASTGLDANLANVTASWDSTNSKVVLSDNNAGPAASIALTAVSGDTGLANLGFTGTNTDHGGASGVTNGALAALGLTAGTYAGQADSPTTLQSIASTIQSALGSSVATVTVNTGNELQIASATKGANSSVTINAAGANDAATTLGLHNATGVGQNISIGEVVANLNAQFASGVFQQAGLTAAATDSAGNGTTGSYITVTSNNGTQFRLNSVNASAATSGKVASSTVLNSTFSPVTVGSNANQFGINVDGAGANTVTVAAGTYSDATSFLAAINSAISANTSLAGKVSASWDAASGGLTLTSASTGRNSSVAVSAGTHNGLSMLGTTSATQGTDPTATAASWTSSSLNQGSYASITVGTVGTPNHNQFSITLGTNSAVAVTLGSTAGSTTYGTSGDFLTALNTAIHSTSLGQSVSAGWDATTGDLTLTSSSTLSVAVGSVGTNLSACGLTGSSNAGNQGKATENLGFGTSGSSFVATDLTNAGANPSSLGSTISTLDAQGVTQSAALSFSALKFGNDKQALTFTATGSDGGLQTTTITLQNNTTAGANRAGASIDDAVAYINQQLQSNTSQPALQQIVAVKESVGGQEQINFISKLSSFTVGVSGTANSGDGLNGGAAQKFASTMNGSGSNIAIDTQAGAQAAITAIASAVSALGTAQAGVGKGENLLNYAINLANSQITNFSAAESQIRDANVAQEAANLSKAQTLQQASIAAMAQANSAPQAVLALLRG